MGLELHDRHTVSHNRTLSLSLGPAQCTHDQSPDCTNELLTQPMKDTWSEEAPNEVSQKSKLSASSLCVGLTFIEPPVCL